MHARCNSSGAIVKGSSDVSVVTGIGMGAVWLDDDVIMEDFLRAWMAGWRGTRLARIPPSYFNLQNGMLMLVWKST
jgi:hypothetical protein